jgi:predicted amidophosphoribosyltransferase
MFCPQCGAENPDNKTLCHRCRKPLAATGAVRASASGIARSRRGRRSHHAAATDQP